jgi:DNA repair protein RecO (recombination protein O)
MKLESVGILISLRPFGERDSIARFFTADFGVMCGMLKGALVAKRNKPLIGQFGSLSWNARIDSQLGVFHFESQKNLALPWMSDAGSLRNMNSALALVATLLPEREKYGTLFARTKDLLENLSDDNYLAWEIELLRELGYALNLGACSNCGRADDLNYLSPKTGRAVCNECAKPYLKQLHKLPLNLETLKKFLEKACRQQGAQLPAARNFL